MCLLQDTLRVCVLSRFGHVPVFVTPWTVAHQAALSMGFSRQEYWSGLPFPSPGDLPDPGIKPTSLTSPALASGFFTTGTTWEALQDTHKWPMKICRFTTQWIFTIWLQESQGYKKCDDFPLICSPFSTPRIIFRYRKEGPLIWILQMSPPQLHPPEDRPSCRCTYHTEKWPRISWLQKLC